MAKKRKRTKEVLLPVAPAMPVATKHRKKNLRSHRLTETRKLVLKSHLAGLAAKGLKVPIAMLARQYGISHSSVSFHWKKILAECTTTKPVTTVRLPIDKRGTDFAIAVGLAEPVKPNGHVTVTIAQEWLKPIVEEVARTEVRDFLQTAFRK